MFILEWAENLQMEMFVVFVAPSCGVVARVERPRLLIGGKTELESLMQWSMGTKGAGIGSQTFTIKFRQQLSHPR